MRFSNTADALVCLFGYLWHDVFHLAASLVGAIVVSKSVHHLLILELVPVRHWKITRETNRHWRDLNVHQSRQPKHHPSHVLGDSKSIRYKKIWNKTLRGSLFWALGGMDPRKMLVFSSLDLNYPSKLNVLHKRLWKSITCRPLNVKINGWP